MKAYNLDTYDDDEVEDSDKEATDFGIFSNVKGLSYYTSNEEDPYITLKDVPFDLCAKVIAGKCTIR